MEKIITREQALAIANNKRDNIIEVGTGVELLKLKAEMMKEQGVKASSLWIERLSFIKRKYNEETEQLDDVYEPVSYMRDDKKEWSMMYQIK